MRLRFLVPMLLAVVAGSLLWLLRGSAPPPPPGPELPIADFGTPAPLAETATTDNVVDASAPADAPPENDTEGEDRSELAVADPADAPAVVGTLVQVVAGNPHRPVPGIEVAWLSALLGDRQLPPGALYDEPQRRGARARTNDRGELQLPTQREPIVVAARDGDAFAAAIVSPGQPQLSLVLVRDETLQLHVVDRDGHGQSHVPVDVYRKAGKSHEHIAGLHTDAAGAAVIPHFQLLRPGETKGEQFAAALRVPLPHTEPVVVGFEGRPCPEAAVTLVLPATAAVSVSLRHRSGAPILASVGMSLTSTKKHQVALVPQGVDRRRERKLLGAMPVVFDHLGCGAELVPAIEVEGARQPVRLPPIKVPTAAGRIEVPLVLTDECFVLAARVLGADSTPLGNGALQYALRLGNGMLASGSFTTIGTGEGDLVLTLPRTQEPLQLVLRMVASDGTVLGCTADFGAVLPGERRDLGALQLEPQPLLARGTARDDRGELLADVHVRVEVERTTQRGTRWQQDGLLSTTAGPDGAFALHGALPRLPFRVVARKDGHFDAVTERLSPGAVLDLRLLRQGILEGRVLLPDWLPERCARVQLQSTDDPERRYAHDLRRKDGVFRLGEIRPGDYTATITVRNVPEPLAVLAGLRIAPGRNGDARLQPLDLGAALHRYRLRAIGPGGGVLTSLEGPILWRRRAASGETTLVTFRWQKGRAEFATPAPFVELVTLGRGVGPTTVSVAAGDHDVYLQPLQPFVVALPGVRGACGPVRAIRVSAVFTGETGLPQGSSGQDQRTGESFSFPRWELGKSGGGWLDVHDRAELALSRGGPHEITLRIYENERQDSRQAAIGLGTIDVAVDGSQAAPRLLAVDPQQLEAALRSLEPQPGTR